MLTKKILNEKQSRDAIEEGMEAITSVVAKTLGPAGKPILLERLGQQLNGEPLAPYITKDGVSVAREAGAPSRAVNSVIQTVKEICNQTNKVAGDGTTTAIVLGQAILKEAFQTIELEKLNSQIVRREIEKTAKNVDEMLLEMATPCQTLDLVESVANISANGDTEIGRIIKQAFEAVGSEGVITVDEAGGKENTIEIVNGFQFKRGAEGNERFFNNDSNTKFEAENCHVIIYNGKLQEPRQVLNALQLLDIHYKGKLPPVLFLADDFGRDALQALYMLRAEQNLSLCAVKGPHATTVRTLMYEDIAVFLGGERLGNGSRNLYNLEFTDIGISDKVVVDKYNTTFYGGHGDEEEVLKRVEKLKIQRSEAESPYDAAILSDRIAGLSEGIAKIGVGGSSDLEIKEKYHRVEDALNAARAALEQGITPGGGITLYRISEALASKKEPSVGDRILAKALKAPLLQIMSNLGEDLDTVKIKISKILTDNMTTYNGFTGDIVNGLEAGIVDPVKVTRTALDRAVSVAATLCTCGGIIIHENPSDKNS